MAENTHDIIIDRDIERSRMRELLEAGAPRLGLMYGRRRVGKTHLLTHGWPSGTRLCYFTAAETTPGQNKEALLATIERTVGESLDRAAFGAWRNVFRKLLDMGGTEPLVIVLDEFQYLGNGNDDTLRAVASELNAEWEATPKSRPLVLVLCGSAVRLIEALNRGGSPLYGRFEWTCKLEPFNYWHASQMVPYQSARAKAAMYGVFGGTPRYLASVNVKQPLVENIARLSLSPQGAVRQLVETALLQEQGLRDHASYNAILRAIGSGRTELNEIRQGAALTEADLTATRVKVDRLVSLGYVHKERNFGAKNTQPFRYRIADAAQAFHAAFVTKLEAMLEQYDAQTVFAQHIQHAFDTYLGHRFELIAPQAFARLQPLRNLPLVKQWGRWEGKDKTRESVEVDIVAELADGRMMTGGVKWNQSPISADWHRHHLRSLTRLADSGVAWAHNALRPDAVMLWIAAGGYEHNFEDAVRERHQQAYLLTLEDLYE